MMKKNVLRLDKTDLKLLAELDGNCRIPATKLAKILGKSRQAVDYRIHQLVKNGIITGFYTAINPHKMGYKVYKMYLKLRNLPERKEALFNYLKQSGTIYWMGECSGSWDVIFGVFSRSDYGFFTFKNEFMAEFSDIIIDEYGDSLIDVLQFQKMYFTQEIKNPVMFAGEVVPNTIDELDAIILEHIVNNGRMSLVELSTKTSSTIKTIQSRLQRMETLGIIIQYRIGVNLDLIDKELYKAIIKIDNYTPEHEKRLAAYVSQLPTTQYFIRNIWDLELELVVDNYQEYYHIIERLKKEFPYPIKTVDSVLMITDEWTPGFKNLLKATM